VETAPARPLPDWRPASGSLVWTAALAAFAALWLWGQELAPWAFEVPRAWRLPLAGWIGGFMAWLVGEAGFGLFTFTLLTRTIAALIEAPYRVALSLLSTGFLEGQGSDAVMIVPSLSWVAVIGVATVMAHHAGGWWLAALVGGCFAFLALFGQWDAAMVTLASILIAVPLGVAGGLLLGIAGHRWPRLGRALVPVLDLMQTVPVFAYLVPILFLFGFGPTSAVVATVIYALPPMTRVAMLALASVPEEVRELGRMVGCTGRQMTWRVLVPSAMPALMVGVNQVIMLSLNMVIIASMIGAGGLGYEVLAALRRLDIGTGVEAGFAIVALAVALDRLSQAYAAKAPAGATRAGGLVARHPHLAVGLALVAATTIGGYLWPWLRDYPEAWAVSTGDFWAGIVQWININYFDTLEAVKSTLLLNVMIPFKRFLVGLPWLGVAGLAALAGWRLGGGWLAALAGGVVGLIASFGLWEEAMTTVYLCGISVVIASLIGMPVAILTAQHRRAWPVVQAIIDTLQTLPSFVYLIPAVMLFRVGDFTAMLAVVAYAIAPAIRYTALGLRQVDPRLVEAGRAAGCTPWQLLVKIRLKLALPEILLGVNQTIMLALSMLVITALVGTRDLGQEVYIALTKADTGRGLVAGLSVAFIAILADRLIGAGAARMRRRLGLVRGAP
jgi:glycine betaine/proline transport system permease protein